MDTDGALSVDSYSTLPPNLFKFYQPQFTTYFAAIFFLILGIVLCIFGGSVYLLQPSMDIFKHDYTDCTDFKTNAQCNQISDIQPSSPCICKVTLKSLGQNINIPNPHIYYRLQNYYQNVREYADSYDSKQLLGVVTDNRASCMKTNKKKNNVFPCGLIARSLFNDTFTFKVKSSTVNLIKTPYYHSDRFKNPAGGLIAKTFANYDQPEFWPKPIYELDTTNPENNGLRNYNFITWMTTYPFPNALKYLGKWPQDQVNLAEDDIVIEITYNYNVDGFKGRKLLIVAPQSVVGFKNMFLPILYFVTAGVMLIFAILFFVYTKVYNYRCQDIRTISLKPTFE